MECIPVRRDEYNVLRNNPFKNNKVLRVDHGDNKIELISNHSISEYRINYIKYPDPIILEGIHPNEIDGKSDVSESVLPPVLHSQILERAVRYAVNNLSYSASPKEN